MSTATGTATARSKWWLAAVVASGALLVLSALATLYVAVTFTAHKVPSQAMTPTISEGSRVLAVRVSPRDVHRGDIVIYRSFAPTAAAFRIGRVVALGGDRVATVDGRVRVNGKPVPDHGRGAAPTTIGAPLVVPAGAVYLLGDNLANSRDSRADGPLPAANIRSRVRFISLPVDWIALGSTLVFAVVFAALLVGGRRSL